MPYDTENEILPIAEESRMNTYQQIQVPHSQANRYTVLLGDCKELINEAVTDVHFFKICRMAIADLMAKRGNGSQGNGPSAIGPAEAGGVKAPQRRKRQSGRLPESENENKSTLAKRKRKRLSASCRVCVARNSVPTDNHRAGSTRCPFTVSG